MRWRRDHAHRNTKTKTESVPESQKPVLVPSISPTSYISFVLVESVAVQTSRLRVISAILIQGWRVKEWDLTRGAGGRGSRSREAALTRKRVWSGTHAVLSRTTQAKAEFILSTYESNN
jgi:hypothetical protein